MIPSIADTTRIAPYSMLDVKLIFLSSFVVRVFLIASVKVVFILHKS